jgi:hypothetical protein
MIELNHYEDVQRPDCHQPWAGQRRSRICHAIYRAFAPSHEPVSRRARPPAPERDRPAKQSGPSEQRSPRPGPRACGHEREPEARPAHDPTRIAKRETVGNSFSKVSVRPLCLCGSVRDCQVILIIIYSYRSPQFSTLKTSLTGSKHNRLSGPARSLRIRDKMLSLKYIY